jgi:RNA polymerase sigma-70 factor (ECF subfamily)
VAIVPIPSPETRPRPAKARAPTPVLADAELVRRSILGDAWAREALFRRYLNDVVGAVTRLIGEGAEVDEVVQDTFATALIDLRSLREPAAFRSWLFGIAIRRVRRVHRRRSARRFLRLDRDEPPSLSALVSEQATPEQLAEIALVERVLAKMPVDDRIAWSLRRIEGEQLEDIAEITGVSLATVKRRIEAVDVLLRARAARGAP